MWVMAMFDLPSVTGADRRRYVRFRKFLLARGFEMRQKSVYLRWEETVARADATCRAVLAQSPCEGCVTVVKMTPRMMAGVQTRVDNEAKPPPQAPDAFLLC